ncbi:Prohibitin-3 [Forsythia ovata]|uniref:Prohibitin n=1 Tax=Forsythia ovata TaxID=205694 RepID=A0ABD1TPX1_9LAMI
MHSDEGASDAFCKQRMPSRELAVATTDSRGEELTTALLSCSSQLKEIIFSHPTQPNLYTVDGGQLAVLFDRLCGVIDETVGEGTHFLVSWLQKPYIFDIRTRLHTFSSASGTKDLQMVNLTLRVLSRPEVNRLPDIFKTQVSNQLLTESPYVSTLVQESLIRRTKDFNIVLDDVAITHLSYGAEFSRAVEQK